MEWFVGPPAEVPSSLPGQVARVKEGAVRRRKDVQSERAGACCGAKVQRRREEAEKEAPAAVYNSGAGLRSGISAECRTAGKGRARARRLSRLPTAVQCKGSVKSRRAPEFAVCE